MPDVKIISCETATDEGIIMVTQVIMLTDYFCIIFIALKQILHPVDVSGGVNTQWWRIKIPSMSLVVIMVKPC